MIPDHGSDRDAAARRELADRVKMVAVAAARRAGASAIHHRDELPDAVDAAGTAVLASDLRARAETRQEFIDRLTEDIKAGRANVGPVVWSAAGHEWREQRERLRKVERLLAVALGEGRTPTSVAAADDGEVRDALAEVRSLLGDG